LRNSPFSDTRGWGGVTFVFRRRSSICPHIAPVHERVGKAYGGFAWSPAETDGVEEVQCFWIARHQFIQQPLDDIGLGDAVEAKVLGLKIPEAFLLRADEVIE